jgi:hypothetical protein
VAFEDARVRVKDAAMLVKGSRVRVEGPRVRVEGSRVLALCLCDTGQQLVDRRDVDAVAATHAKPLLTDREYMLGPM